MNSARTAFIFDMDGTLVDNMGVHLETWIALFAEHGRTLTAQQFHEQASGKTTFETLRLLFDPRLSDAQCQALADQKEAHYRRLYRPRMRLVAGLAAFLDQARRLGIPMAVATSAPQPNVEFVLDGLDLRRYFGVVVGGDDIRRGKPDPEIFLLAARRLGAAPDQCIVFEDSQAGIEAARRAGMRAIALTTSVPAEELCRAPHVEQAVPNFTGLDAAQIARLT